MNKENKKILIAIDGSKQSMDAALYASEVLPSQQTDVLLFHVRTEIPAFLWDFSISPDSSRMSEVMAEWMAHQDQLVSDSMQKAKGYFADAGFPEKSVHIKVQMRTTGIARNILAEARNGYTAVIVGRTGEANVIGVNTGSVTSKLVDKMGHHTLADVALMVVDGKPNPKKILIGFDGSENAQKAVSFVATMSGGTDLFVTICQVIRAFKMNRADHADLVEACLKYPFPEEIEKQLQHRDSEIIPLIEASKKKLLAAGLGQNHIDSVILRGYASRSFGLVEEARKGEYGTIVLGRKGVSAVKEFFIGRVGKKVLQLADNLAVWIVSG
jgi:nucleotide-binding universal stress UspA family protein